MRAGGFLAPSFTGHCRRQCRCQDEASVEVEPGGVYITSVSAAGSHLPLVVRRYKDSVDCMSPTVAYGVPQLDQTGQLNVGAQLVQRDPALAGFGGVRR